MTGRTRYRRPRPEQTAGPSPNYFGKRGASGRPRQSWFLSMLWMRARIASGNQGRVTTREGRDHKLLVDRSKEIYIQEEEPNNLADVETYIRGFLGRRHATFQDRLAGWKITERILIDVLT